jgi:hypothetical protein
MTEDKDKWEKILSTALKDGDPLKSYEVVELGETIYFRPLTALDVAHVQRKHKDFLKNPTIDGMVDLIIFKALDANGEKILTLTHKPLLMRMSVDVIANLAADMIGTTSLEDQEKN